MDSARAETGTRDEERGTSGEEKPFNVFKILFHRRGAETQSFLIVVGAVLTASSKCSRLKSLRIPVNLCASAVNHLCSLDEAQRNPGMVAVFKNIIFSRRGAENAGVFKAFTSFALSAPLRD